MNENAKQRQALRQRYLDYRLAISGVISKLWKTKEDDLINRPEYTSALKFWNDFKESEPSSIEDIGAEVNYDAVVPYARELYER